MAKSWFEKKHAKKEYDLLYHEERAVVEATEEILGLMERAGKSKADVAKALGKSKAYVTQALSGERNMTLRTFASFAWACGFSLRGFVVQPIEAGQTVESLDVAARLEWVAQADTDTSVMIPQTVRMDVEQDLALAA